MTEMSIEELSGVANEYLSDQWGSHAARALPTWDDVTFRAHWNELSALGWEGLFAPESVGGLSLPHPHLVAIFEAIGAHLLPGLSLDAFVGAPSLLSSGSTQSQDVLRRHIRGEVITIVAPRWVNAAGTVVEEPWDGVVMNNGRLAGERALIDHAHLADHFVVPARKGDEPVIALCAADACVELERLTSIDVCSAPANVSFRGGSVIEVIASGAEAVNLWAIHATTVRIAVAAEMLGACEALLNMALDYATVRVAFGKPIAMYQAIRHMLAQMQVDLHALRVIVKAAAAAAAAAEPHATDLALSAKARAARVGKSIREAALQVHAGIGFTQEHDLHLYFKRTMTLESLGGDQRELVRVRGYRTLSGSMRRID